MVAAWRGRLDVVKYLVAKEATLNTKDRRENSTALVWAF